MRQLYFSAFSANTKVAPALLRQTENTLRPFSGYLRVGGVDGDGAPVAVRAALAGRRRPAGARLDGRRPPALGPVARAGLADSGWHADAVPDTRHQLMVVNRNLTVDVLSCVHDVEGLRLQIDGAVEPEGQVFWGGHACSLVREPAPAPPVSVLAEDGSALTLRRTPRAEDGGWLLS